MIICHTKRQKNKTKKSSGVEKRINNKSTQKVPYMRLKLPLCVPFCTNILYSAYLWGSLKRDCFLRPRIRTILEISENDNQIFVSIDPGSVQQYKDSLQRQFLKHTVHSTLEKSFQNSLVHFKALLKKQHTSDQLFQSSESFSRFLKAWLLIWLMVSLI